MSELTYFEMKLQIYSNTNSTAKYTFESGNQSFNSLLTLLTHSSEFQLMEILVSMLSQIYKHIQVLNQHQLSMEQAGVCFSASLANIGGFNLNNGGSVDTTKISSANYVSIGKG